MGERQMRFDIVLDAPFEQVLSAVRKPRAMEHVCRPLVRFRPVERREFPEHWRNGEYRVSLWLFGIVPLGRQVIGIDFAETDGGGEFTGFDRGHSMLMKRWVHKIGVRRQTPDSTAYFDELTVDAGWLTPIAAFFVKLLFRHRQKRLAALARTRFAGLDS